MNTIIGSNGGGTYHSSVQLVPASSGVGGLGSLVGVLIGLLGLVVLLAVVGVLVIVVAANRAEPDPSGRRPLSVYLFATSFIALIAAVVGSVTVVSSLVQLIGSHPGPSLPGIHPIGDAAARGAVLGGLITVVSVAILVVHLRQGLLFARADGEAGPSQRVARSYVAAVAFLSVLILLAGTVMGIYLLFEIAGPGIFGGGGGRIPAVRNLIIVAYVVLVADLILYTHRDLVTPGLRFRKAAAIAPPG
ncbi:MAG TPA: hypothetical protein VNV87_06155 [Acidimicrobiales bacterium]|jgi:hypothetical protein|nr:hypothetical protein [Acidimicrobiales bacterium]